MRDKVAELAERITCIFNGATLQVKFDIENKSDARKELEQLVVRELEKAVAIGKYEVWNEVGVVLSGFSRSIRKVDLIKVLEVARKESEHGSK